MNEKGERKGATGLRGTFTPPPRGFFRLSPDRQRIWSTCCDRC